MDLAFNLFDAFLLLDIFILSLHRQYLWYLFMIYQKNLLLGYISWLKSIVRVKYGSVGSSTLTVVL